MNTSVGYPAELNDVFTFAAGRGEKRKDDLVVWILGLELRPAQPLTSCVTSDKRPGISSKLCRNEVPMLTS
ncbi:hypothetical protein Y1Q_0022287 [Alligator mississippiensis]|uniref:Uncharacterized protein n=1 Tax=Alligator mississippiensis TaxID=8496 RepID=A0A151P0M4_ALLMI|nr:hypothetical protein Y1Q_0022287 [Alligator mississippiensis]